MSTYALFLSLAAFLPAQSQIPGSDPAASTVAPAPILAEQHGLPGDLPGTERWIVHFKKRSFDLSGFRQAVYSGASADHVAKIVKGLEQEVIADQAAFAKVVAGLGGKVHVQWWIINACAVDVPHAVLARLQATDNVERLEPDQETFPVIKTATNASNHNADALQAKGVRGIGVTTAIMDTGQDSNMGTSGRPHRTYFRFGNIANNTSGGIGGSRLILNKKIGTMVADDVHGHGTGVASIVAGGSWGTATADHGHAFEAKIAGYSIANATNGNSSSTTMTTAWQSIAADKVKYKTVSANNSYSGSPSPLNSTQKALDSAAYNADILICVAAGNKGTTVTASQIAVNGLSVGAVNENSKTLASFSCRGIVDGQVYPDICANGVSTNMARRNLETSDYIGSGTSMASPQVCGAATQIRAANAALRADETKAILLASTLKNTGASSTQVSTGPGCGYLKNDTAYAIAMAAKRHGRVNLSKTTPGVRFDMAVTKGLNYQVAIAWHRQNVSSTTWSNIDLRIKDGASTVLLSNKSRNTEEFVRFTAAKTGVFQVEITATSLAVTTQPVAWASTVDLTPSKTLPGTYTLFSSGCQGSFTVAGTGGTVFPKANTTTWGSSANYFGIGRANQRYQQVMLGSEAPASMIVNGYSLRQDNSTSGRAGGTQTYTVLLGYTKYSPGTITSAFASNFNAGISPTVVFSGNVNIPTWTGTNTSLKNFGFSVKFPKPWVYVRRTGENLLFELRNTSTTSVLQYPDATTVSGAISRIYGTTATASTGTVQRNYGLVMRFDTASSPVRVAPALSNSGVPELGKVFRLNIAQAKTSTAAVLIFGLSKSSWGAIKLPLNLSFLGAKDCNLLCSYDLTFVTATNTAGNGGISFGVPNVASMRGKIFHNQYFVIDKAANGLGLAFTNGGSARIGG